LLLPNLRLVFATVYTPGALAKHLCAAIV
jgi:hypothetical protein